MLRVDILCQFDGRRPNILEICFYINIPTTVWVLKLPKQELKQSVRRSFLCHDFERFKISWNLMDFYPNILRLIWLPLRCQNLQPNNLFLALFLAMIKERMGINTEDFLFRTGNKDEPVKVFLSSGHSGGRRKCQCQAE